VQTPARGARLGAIGGLEPAAAHGAVLVGLHPLNLRRPVNDVRECGPPYVLG